MAAVLCTVAAVATLTLAEIRALVERAVAVAAVRSLAAPRNLQEKEVMGANPGPRKPELHPAAAAAELARGRRARALVAN